MQFDFKNIFLKKELSKEELAIKGDKEAFSELIRENKLTLYRVAKGILTNEQNVEDAIQNTILKSYKNINKLKSYEYFKTWLIRILINECKNIIKNEKKIVYMDDITMKDNHEDKYEDVDLSEAINNLDKDLKAVTVLYYYEDIAQKEIANILGVNENTVRTRLLRARRKLYKLLQNEKNKRGDIDG